MGNKQQTGMTQEVERDMDHPRFAKSKIVNLEGNTQQLQTTMSIDEKEYDKWKTALAIYNTE